MAKARKTASGSWEIVAYLGKDANGKKRYKHLTADKKSEVEEMERQLRVSMEAQDLDAMQMTVGQAVDAYIERREKTASPKTIREYKSYRRTAFPRLMTRKIGELTDDICQQEIDAYAKDHAPKSVSLRWNLVIASIKWKHPRFNVRVELPEVKRKRLEMPEEEDLSRLFADLRGHGMEIPVLLSATCGLRRGEIAALDLVKDIDYEKGIIHITKDMVIDEHNKYVIKPPKTDAANRAVVCPRWVLDILAAARDNPDYKMYAPNSMSTGFRRLAVKYGIQCSFHGLRHYYASAMAALNVPEAYAMERMGHATNHMLKRYQEYLKSKEVEIDEALAGHMDSLNPGQKIPSKSDNEKTTDRPDQL